MLHLLYVSLVWFKLERLCQANMSLLLNEPEFMVHLINCVCAEGEEEEAESHQVAGNVLVLIGE